MLIIIGVMGGGAGSPETLDQAQELGRLIAEKGWALLNGGRDCGVMAASAEGAARAGGLVVGILPGEDLRGASNHLTIAIPTGMGDGRNIINVLASRVVVALRGGAGTVSEIALGLKSGRHVIALDFPLGAEFAAYVESGMLLFADTPAEAVRLVAALVGEEQR